MVQPWILDIGCGDNKYPNSLGMDKRQLKNIDIVHDIEDLPWPILSNSFHEIKMFHVMEHLKPWLTIGIMDEIWRILILGGTLELIMPVAGSTAFYSDPTHIKSWNIHTVEYFNIESNFKKIYNPKPWKVLKNKVNHKEYLEIILEKIDDK